MPMHYYCFLVSFPFLGVPVRRRTRGAIGSIGRDMMGIGIPRMVHYGFFPLSFIHGLTGSDCAYTVGASVMVGSESFFAFVCKLQYVSQYNELLKLADTW